MNKFQIAQRNAIINAHLTAIRAAELARHPEVVATLKLFPPKLRAAARLSVSDFSNSVHFALTLEGLDSFKDTQLTKLLANFADANWQSSSVDFTHNETPNRDFHFTRKVNWTPKPSKHTKWIETHCGEYHVPAYFDINVGVYAYVKSDSPLCRMVVTEVKEEIVRKEIKQIVCA